MALTVQVIQNEKNCDYINGRINTGIFNTSNCSHLPSNIRECPGAFTGCDISNLQRADPDGLH